MTIELIPNLLTTTARKWWDDNPWRLSAALSYYTLFSLAPLLTLAVAGAATMVDETVVQEELIHQLQELIGEKGADALTPMLHSAGHPVHGTLATLIGLNTPFYCLYGHVQRTAGCAEFHLADPWASTEFCAVGAA